ncbi:MAG: PstS family phosphate ABC transporter substrate-binding protein [Prochloraceae cyanobacterium]|nr:PstS family phosphate ABC transporter substrate-binding protein [Prochloraceae cyanobacterium]
MNVEVYNKILGELEKSSDSPYIVLEQILSWTNRNVYLTDRLCEIVNNFPGFISSGQEAAIVKKLVQTKLVKNWQTSVAAEHFKEIRDRLLEKKRGVPRLLILYRQVLEQEKVPAKYTQEEQVLLHIGLLDVYHGDLVVYNPIYKNIFNLNWVEQHFAKIEKQRQKAKNNKNKQYGNPVNRDKNSVLNRQDRNKSSLLWFLSLVGIAITSSVFIFLNGAKLIPQNFKTESKQESIINPTQQLVASNKIQNFPLKNLELVGKFIEVEDVPYGTFNYGGSTSWATIRSQIQPNIASVWPEFKLHYVQHPVRSPSSGSGIYMLLHNELVFAQSSRPLSLLEYSQAKERGFTLQQIPVAIDGIVFAVNPNLNIPGLTLNQLRDIYTGKITNWKQVGGPDLEITMYSKSTKVSGTAQFFTKKVLLGQKFSPKVKIVSNITTTLRQIATNKGAIFYASAAEIIGQCKVKPLSIGNTSQEFVPPYVQPYIEPEQCPASRNQINYQVFHNGSYPLLRDLYVIMKQNGGIEEEVGKAYASLLLSKEGQRLIQKTGFVPIR